MPLFLSKKDNFFTKKWLLAISLKHKNKIRLPICKFEISAINIQKWIKFDHHFAFYSPCLRCRRNCCSSISATTISLIILIFLRLCLWDYHLIGFYIKLSTRLSKIYEVAIQSPQRFI